MIDDCIMIIIRLKYQLLREVRRENDISILTDLQPRDQGKCLASLTHTTSLKSIDLSI